MKSPTLPFTDNSNSVGPDVYNEVHTAGPTSDSVDFRVNKYKGEDPTGPRR